MAANTSMEPRPPVNRAPTTCRSCRECAVLASHVLRIPGSPMVRVQLHELDREMHIHVRQTDPQTGHIYKTLKILLESSTEWSTEFYAAYMLALAPEGSEFVKELVGAPTLARTVPAAPTNNKRSNIPIEELSRVFHLPINAASKELGICPTSLKKICRRNGLARWPHRKVKSMEAKLAKSRDNKVAGAPPSPPSQTERALSWIPEHFGVADVPAEDFRVPPSDEHAVFMEWLAGKVPV